MTNSTVLYIFDFLVKVKKNIYISHEKSNFIMFDFTQGQRHLGLDFTWDKDNGNLTWIDNWLWSTINLDQQLTWISNQLGSIIKLDQQSTLHLDQQLTYIYN